MVNLMLDQKIFSSQHYLISEQ